MAQKSGSAIIGVAQKWQARCLHDYYLHILASVNNGILAIIAVIVTISLFPHLSILIILLHFLVVTISFFESL